MSLKFLPTSETFHWRKAKPICSPRKLIVCGGDFLFFGFNLACFKATEATTTKPSLHYSLLFLHCLLRYFPMLHCHLWNDMPCFQLYFRLKLVRGCPARLTHASYAHQMGCSRSLIAYSGMYRPWWGLQHGRCLCPKRIPALCLYQALCSLG